MDGIEGLLARDFGVRPQGKAAPMAASRPTAGSAWPNPRSTSASNPSAPSYDGLFGAPAPAPAPAPAASIPSYDSLFDSFNGPATTAPSSSSAARTGPVFDDDIFNAVPGMKASNSTFSTARYDGNLFGAAAAPAYDDLFASNRSVPPSYDDFLGGFAGKPQGEERKGSVVVEDDDLLGGFERRPVEEKKKPVMANKNVSDSGFDDLIPGFGGSSQPKSRTTNEVNKRKPTVPTSKSTASMAGDPFVVLETASASGSAYASPGRFTDPVEDLDNPVNSEGKNVDSTAADGSLFEDSSPFDQVPKSDPLFTSGINGDTKDSHPRSKARDSSPVQSSVNRNPASRPTEDFGNVMPKSQSERYSDIHVDDSSERYSGNGMGDQSPISTESEDDIWLTVSEIPLFTQPTSAPPPSRSPPRLKQKRLGAKVNGMDDEYAPRSSQNHNHYKDLPKQAGVSSIDEPGGVPMDRPQMPAYNDSNAFDDDEEFDINSSSREEKERQEIFEQAQEVKLKEEKEREQRRLEKERELEQQRERQAVERATKEARERAAAEARAKAETEARQRSQRAAVQRAHQEARGRAAAEAKDRVARAAAEEREKSAVEARERAAAEAKEKERAAARERAAAERAATERVQQEARKRAERAAVERAAAEARERQAAAAAAAAREKQAAAAAAVAREKKSTPDDLESFFGMDARANSAPKQRAPTVDSMFDSQPQSRGTANGSQRTASTSSSTSKTKASSTSNIFGNDLSDLFGAPASSDVFQEVEGESEERRRARLERHQRTSERAAKALAEKNERDMQVQREQAERDRIGDTLDFEIKRWAAGKEGNLRALLSTLQYILWPECGWQTVSLTDLITGAAVKKQYRKATLCIHPDKVQQKGATLQQKYIAEKVFDILKEAWTKFNSEELF